MDMQKVQRDIHENAKAHGFWEANSDFGTKIALVHSEVSEAFEEYRKGDLRRDSVADGSATIVSHSHMIYQEGDKPEGIGIELADAVIRILDLAEWLQLDMETLIAMKMAYNKGRPFMHGGKTV